MLSLFEDLLRQTNHTVSSLVALLRRVADSTWLQSTEPTVTIATGATTATVTHGLGRAANGAVVVSARGPVQAVFVDPPTALDTITVRLSGAAASDVTLKLRVY